MRGTPEEIIDRRLERRRTADALAALAARAAVMILCWVLMTGGIFRLVRAESDDPEEGIRRGDVLVTCLIDGGHEKETGAVPGRVILVVHRLRPEPGR